MFALRMHITVPYKKFWREMWALILSSLAMLVVMGGVLIYIVRTMFREKTLEQMRRDLTHNITHELKTPIAIAATANEALRNFSADADPERRGRYLSIVDEQLQQLRQMVEHILTVSVEESESHNPEPINVKELLEQVSSSINRNNKRVEYVTICDEELTIVADSFHLRNILTTIVDNSVKYSGESVRVVVSALRNTSGVEFTVEDNGNGMSSEHLKHIFEKFYRVPTGDIAGIRGFGLGLYYARRVVERHGGTIEAQSRIGRGTVITIKLPDDGRED
jgi:signal transduction histidine kinase